MFLCDNHWEFLKFSIFQIWNKSSEKHFKKLKYHFLVVSTRIDNAAFPYKTALLETSVKTILPRAESWKFTPRGEMDIMTFLHDILNFFIL